MRSVCVGVAETGGMDTYAKRVCWRRRDRGGMDTYAKRVCWRRRDREGRRPLQDKTQLQQIAKIKKYALCPVSVQTSARPPHFYMRACRQCVHESARLPRVSCSHAWYAAVAESMKPPTLSSALCRTHLPRMARATNSCTREEISKRGERSL